MLLYLKVCALSDTQSQNRTTVVYPPNLSITYSGKLTARIDLLRAPLSLRQNSESISLSHNRNLPNVAKVLTGQWKTFTHNYPSTGPSLQLVGRWLVLSPKPQFAGFLWQNRPLESFSIARSRSHAVGGPDAISRV